MDESHGEASAEATPLEGAQLDTGAFDADDLQVQDDLADAVEATLAERESDTDTEDAAEEAGRGNREARFRKRAREAEAHVAALQEQVAALQKAEVERRAGEVMHDPQDLWGRVELTNLVAEDGTIDGEALSNAIVGLPAHFKKPTEPLYVQGFQGKGEPQETTTWADVLSNSKSYRR